MARSKNRGKSERTPRLRIPPPPPFWLYDRQKGFFGLSILHETDGSTGLALWRAARTARLFVEAAPKRRELFRSLSTAKLRDAYSVDPPDSDSGLHLDAFIQARSRMADVTEAELAAACARVSEWAGAGWKKQTELHFAELAARADPTNPALANAAARLCREASLSDRSALWFERGFRFAVRTGNRSEAVSSLLGYGALMKECGRLEEAKRWFLKAAKRAARTGRKKSAAETRHDLMALAAEAGDDVAEIIEHAEAAVELYPLHHRRLPYLAHDFAFALIQKHQFSLAYPLLELFVRVVPKRHLLPGVATFAWAAAGRGLVHRYDDAERRALAQIEVDQQQAAPSLIFLAQGARALRRWTRAERHAQEAIASAVRMKQPRYEHDARALLIEIQEQRPMSLEEVEMVEVYPLTRHFQIRLRRWKPPHENDNRGSGENQASG